MSDGTHSGLTFRLWLRLLLRESRGGRSRLGFFALCLGIGVAAVVSIAGLATSLDQGIRGEARQLLAADLAVEGRRPIPPEVDAVLATVPGVRRTDIKEMVTVVASPQAASLQASTATAPGRSQLVELKVVADGYPFYGTVELDPAAPSLASLLPANGTVVAQDLLDRVALAVGDDLLIGGERFRINGVVRKEPDRISDAFSNGPRVFLSPAGLARTGLEATGSRISRKALIKLPDGAPAELLAELDERLTAALPVDQRLRVETYAEAQPNLRRGLERVQRFLGLVALLSLLIGGVGVAQTVRAWVAGRLDAIAVLRCLGLRPREVLSLYLGQVALLAALGSLLGAAAGLLLQRVLPLALGDLVPSRLIHLWQPWALVRGVGLGIAVAVLFSLAPLLAARSVPPIRVLRRSAEPLPSSRWVRLGLGAVLTLGVAGLAIAQSHSLALGLQFTVGLAIALGLLTGSAWLLVRGVARLPRTTVTQLVARLGRLGRGLGPAFRHGLASLAHPAAGNVSAAVALGLGVLVVTALTLVERHLTNELGADLPTNAPSAFLIDIQTAQWPGVEALLTAQGAADVDSVPVVMARLAVLDGKPVADIGGRRDRRAEEEGDEPSNDRRWALTREQRLTYLARLPADNKLVAATSPAATLDQPWQDADHAEVSIEKDFAERLGLHLGSVIRFDIQGVPLELTVSSIRTVDWRTFKINFFLVVEPGVLEAAPQMRIAAARLPPGGEQRVQDRLAAAFPNVTLLQIRDILDRIRRVLERLGLGVRILGSFTVVAGIAILAGAVAATASRRGREVALLKTLGMTRAGVAGAFAIEQALVGLVAGIVGTAAGAALAYGVVTRGMELAWHLDPGLLATLMAGTVVLASVAGVAASGRALAQRPIEVLRAAD
jgi:putative ABC transport system permease protein